jgi:hypothetical protein
VITGDAPLSRHVHSDQSGTVRMGILEIRRFSC